MKLLLFFLLLNTACVCSQNTISVDGEEINEIDSIGKKTGFWKLSEPEKGILISGTMKDDIFVSTIDYYQYGKLILSQRNDNNLIFYKDGQRVQAKLVYDPKTDILDQNGNSLDEETKISFYRIAELKPHFYGGKTAFSDFLYKNLNHSKIGKRKGRVIIKFQLNENGEVEMPEVEEGDDPILIEEALRVIKKSPRFQPGFQRGKFVKVKYKLPINF